MGRYTKLPLPHRQALNRTLLFMKKAPRDIALEPGFYVRAIRYAIGMTQATLASRAGLHQSHVAEIEAGRRDVHVGTLRRVFEAMGCGLIIAPRAEIKPSEILGRRLAENPERPWRRTFC
ncbi:MAG: helix-turn-helix transcriptional regulator [Elusimicrobia bacterium]|nr:helix-turn-helix transcriptional regulator [Elusimicrobiota bacterium]